MYNLILNLAFFGSFGVIVYLLARTLPRVSDSGEPLHTASWFDRLLTKLPLKEIDARLTISLEKTLRRMKVLVMRVDNFITGHLKRIRTTAKRSEEKAENSGLFEKLNDGTKE